MRGCVGRAARVAAWATVMATAAATASCTGEPSADPPQPAPGAPSSTSAAEPDRPLVVSRVSVAGSLPRPQRRVVSREVAAVVSSYVDAAFLSGPSTGAASRDAFARFVPSVRRQARRDADVLSDAAFRDGTQVRARRQQIRLDVLAPSRTPAGVTAHLRLLLDLDKAGRRLLVSGRLLLTPRGDTWAIFGYDVHVGSVRATTGPTT